MRRKLIEVALPLEAINAAAAREKSIRHGHPSTLHLWWARRPLAAARAVLFAQLVDDPSSWPELAGDEAAQKLERERLFRIIENIVEWEDSRNETRIGQARREIARSHARFHREAPGAERVLADDATPDEINRYLATQLPPVHDPFAGGGTIPLEAQRLGLRAIASDLNPVAVLINKALIEIPPKFAGQPPVNPESSKVKKDWKGAEGLAEDVRYYGRWMRDEAFKRIGHLYPKVQLPKEHGGGEATVIAWLWARTVKCPNPSCGATMPLARSFVLGTKKGKEAWTAPVIDSRTKTVRFEVRPGLCDDHASGTVDRRGARCVVCRESAPLDHVRTESQAGRMGTQLMAIVAEGRRGRIYVSPSPDHELTAWSATPAWSPELEFVKNSRHMTPWVYGLTTWGSLFTRRQLAFYASTGELPRLCEGTKSVPYLATYLSLALTRTLDRHSSLSTWDSSPTKEQARGVFARTALAMSWDFAESNPFGNSSGNLDDSIEWVAKVLDQLPSPVLGGVAQQADARDLPTTPARIISTDPPYYDNVPYADLSDLFYVWLKYSTESEFPSLFRTMLVPKETELVADSFRQGSSEAAKHYFEQGQQAVFRAVRAATPEDSASTIYYAFKQSDSSGTDDVQVPNVASTGWETMLEGLINSGWSLHGTWPMRTELGNRMRNIGSNALASSIVLVCRRRPDKAPSVTRADFLKALKRQLPRDLKLLQQGNIAPVDFAQAAIGPGMAVFSSYARVLESDGSPMSVRTALQIINQVLDEVLSEQEGDFDADTRCALAWFEQHQYEEGEFGSADTLARAKNTAVAGLVDAGILRSSRGKVRLLRRDELDAAWDPATDARRTVWEVMQHLIRTLETKGEAAAGALLGRVGAQGDAARELAYRLYSLCERKKWAAEALAYNGLVTSWPELTKLAAGDEATTEPAPKVQPELFEA